MSRRRRQTLDTALRAGRIGTFGLFFFGIAAVTPLTIVVGALALAFGQVQQLGTPVAYVIAAMLLGLFAAGLAAMARHVPNSGAFYSYAAAGIGKAAGVATAAIALLAYNAIQIGLYGAFGVAASAALNAAGVHAPWSLWAVLAWVLIAVLGQLRVKLNARILAVLVVTEIAVVVLLDAVLLSHPAGGVVRFDALNPVLLANPQGVAFLVGAITGLVGFEIPLAFAVLSKDPRHSPRRAIALILLVVAVLYAGSAWAMTVVAGPDRIIVVAAEHTTDLFFYLASPYVPAVVVQVAGVLFVTSLFAAMLAFHSTVARYSLTLAREGVLPSWLARTRADEVPVTASAAQSAVAVMVLIAAVLLGLDPTLDLFFFGTVSGGLGILILISIAAVAVARFFRTDHRGESLWRSRIAPPTATVLLTVLTLLTVAFFGQLLGTSSPVKTWAAPVAYLLVAVAGLSWANRLRRIRPATWNAIGHGDRALTTANAGRGPLTPSPRPPIPATNTGA